MNSKLLFSIAHNFLEYPRSEIEWEDVHRSHNALLDYLQKTPPNEAKLYGVDTNFGPHAYKGLPDRLKIQESLVNHLSVTKSNSENYLSLTESRAVLAARIRVLGLGVSGVRPELIESLIEFINQGDIPLIPLYGSLGASGDLIPLSAIAKFLQDRGWNWEPKEAIAITNGTSFMVGTFAMQVETMGRLGHLLMEGLSEMFCHLEVFPDAFHSDLGTYIHSPGAVFVSKYLTEYICRREKKDDARFQDSYILRAIPQIWGSFIDTMSRLHLDVNRELNSVSDNPVYSFSEGRFVEGALFYGSHISMMIDEWNLTVVSLSNWLERMIQFLLDPKENENRFPLLLSREPGESAGLAGLGLLATHTIAEMRRDAHPSSIQSLPSNAGNQNIVPMGSLGIIRNRRTLNGFTALVEIFLYCIRQISHLDGIKPKVALIQKITNDTAGLDNDRPLDEDLASIERILREEIPVSPVIFSGNRD